MHNKARVVCLLVVFLSAFTSVVKGYSGGDGSATNPYQIADVNDLLELADTPGDYGACFVLTSDIDLAGRTFTTALIAPDTDSASYYFEGTAFTGTFDGAGHLIRNLTIAGSGNYYVGLFGYVYKGQIMSVGLVDAIIDGRDYVGGLVGSISSGMLSSCYVTGAVNGLSRVGGLVGENSGTIFYCYATGSVNGTGFRHIGGLVGANNGIISSCYSTGPVKGGIDVGGLVGGNGGTISFCYATGTVKSFYLGDTNFGGLVGDNKWGIVDSCFWDIQTSGHYYSFDGKGVTTSQMKMISTFQNAGWADKGWVMNDGIDYPRLNWEGTGGIEIPVATIPFEGNGTPSNPYLIQTKEEFALLSWYSVVLDKHIKLEANLDLNGITVCPIDDLGVFTGVFDGNYHIIQNFIIDQPVNSYAGLFRRIRSGGCVKNLNIENVSIRGVNYVGGICGENEGTIENCGVTGSVIGTYGYSNFRICGGLCGSNSGGNILSCFSLATVQGDGHFVGGLVGWIQYRGIGDNQYVIGSIERSWAKGVVNGINYVGGLSGSGGCLFNRCHSECVVSGRDEVGGLIGSSGGTVRDCYAIGEVYGSTSVGGLIGSNNNNSEISRSYAACLVSGSEQVGGFIGDYTHCEAKACFWDVQLSGISTGTGSGSNMEVTGKTTSEMQMEVTFLSGGWDFTKPVWFMHGRDYPKLALKSPDIYVDGRVDLFDLARLAEEWLSVDCGFCNKADLTGDQKVNLYDLSLLAAHWLEEDQIRNHLFEIELGVGYDHEDPDDPLDDTYDFEISFLTDETVVLIEFTTPAGNTFSISPDDCLEESLQPDGYLTVEREYDEGEYGAYEWDYEYEFFSADSLAAYGDGLYTVTVTYENGLTDQTEFWFGMPGTFDPIPQPTHLPRLIGISDGDAVVSPAAFSWQPCTDPAARLIFFDYEHMDEDIEEEFLLATDRTGLDGLLDLPGGGYELWLGFVDYYIYENTDGITIDVGKYCESDYEITVE